MCMDLKGQTKCVGVAVAYLLTSEELQDAVKKISELYDTFLVFVTDMYPFTKLTKLDYFTDICVADVSGVDRPVIAVFTAKDLLTLKKVLNREG